MDISIFPRNENRNITPTLQQDTVYFPGAFVSPPKKFSVLSRKLLKESCVVHLIGPPLHVPPTYLPSEINGVHKALTHKEALPKLRNQWCS